LEIDQHPNQRSQTGSGYRGVFTNVPSLFQTASAVSEVYLQLQGSPAASVDRLAPSMAADSSRSWVLFAGGVIIGSATAAGAAYALTSHMLSKQQQQQFREQHAVQQVSHGGGR
jgi:hypothetical protein